MDSLQRPSIKEILKMDLIQEKMRAFVEKGGITLEEGEHITKKTIYGSGALKPPKDPNSANSSVRKS